MAWTQTDLDAAKAAFAQLAAGTKVVRVQFSDRTVEYQQTTVDDLSKLIATIQADLAANAATPRPKQFLGYASGGF